MLTSVYKDEFLGNKDTSTNIVNSFVKEWKKQGHEVLVIHNSHCYPRVIHEIPEKLKKSLAARMGFAISDYDAVKEKEYQDNGVKVFRLPIKKFIPHSQPSDNVIKRQVNKIVATLKKEKFEPDVITGHWASPQMEIISELKTIYHCKTAVVLHGTGYIESPKFNAEEYLKNIDSLGARSLSQAKQIKEILKLDKLPFVCNSGVPDEYLKNYRLNTEKYRNIKTWKITYVGRLVSYKNIDSTIKALSEIKDVKWEFNIVGDGASRTELEELAAFNAAARSRKCRKDPAFSADFLPSAIWFDRIDHSDNIRTFIPTDVFQCFFHLILTYSQENKLVTVIRL